MQHRNAPLTPNGRLRMVQLVEQRGLTFEAAAAASYVAKSTAWEWVRRWRSASAEERRTLGCLEDRPSTPRRSPRMLSAADHDRVCAARAGTGWGPPADPRRGRNPARHRSPGAAPAGLLAPAPGTPRGGRALRVALPG
jgi:transposase-like protein